MTIRACLQPANPPGRLHYLLSGPKAAALGRVEGLRAGPRPSRSGSRPSQGGPRLAPRQAPLAPLCARVGGDLERRLKDQQLQVRPKPASLPSVPPLSKGGEVSWGGLLPALSRGELGCFPRGDVSEASPRGPRSGSG